jgi:hypothetical protein
MAANAGSFRDQCLYLLLFPLAEHMALGDANKIAALNWRWRIQFGHRGFQIGSVSCDCSLTAPVSALHRLDEE